jgi:hypothetical protein
MKGRNRAVQYPDKAPLSQRFTAMGRNAYLSSIWYDGVYGDKTVIAHDLESDWEFEVKFYHVRDMTCIQRTVLRIGQRDLALVAAFGHARVLGADVMCALRERLRLYGSREPAHRLNEGKTWGKLWVRGMFTSIATLARLEEFNLEEGVTAELIGVRNEYAY